MKNIKNVLTVLFLAGLLSGLAKIAYADVTLTIKDDGAVVYSGTYVLPPPGLLPINDTGGSPHDVDGNSVLSVVYAIDQLTSSFSISELTYYPSFSAFYLRCINTSNGERCDDWMYKVNGAEPSVGMDQNILTGSENVILYFGNENAPSAIEAAPINNSVMSGGAVTAQSFVAEIAPVTPLPPVEEAPILEKVEEIKPVEEIQEVELEVKMAEILNPEPKKEKVKVAKKISKPETNDSLVAAPIVAAMEISAPAVKKESVVKKFFRWIFGW